MILTVRIAVAANAKGEYFAYGHHASDGQWNHLTETFDQLDDEQKFWVEAEIEVAEHPIPVVAGTVLEV